MIPSGWMPILADDDLLFYIVGLTNVTVTQFCGSTYKSSEKRTRRIFLCSYFNNEKRSQEIHL
jgi:hypothetical protein